MKLTQHKKDLQEKATEPKEEIYTLGIAPNVKSEKMQRKTYSRIELFEMLTTHVVKAKKDGVKLYLQGDVRAVGQSKTLDNLKDIQIFVGDFDNEVKKVLTPKTSSKYVSMEQAVKLLSNTPYCGTVSSSYRHMQEEDTDKGRFVIPLAEPFIIDAKDPEHSNKLWKEISKLIMEHLKFPDYDPSSDKAAQAFYFPSCPSAFKHKKFAQVINSEGELLDWRQFENAARIALSTKHVVAGVDEEEALIYERLDCRLFLKVFPDFDLIAAHGKNAGKAINGGRAITCPFDDEHSETGDDSKTLLYNRDKVEDKPWGWNCMGGSCDERTRAQYLYKSLQNGTLTLSTLEDGALGGGSLDPLKSAGLVTNDTPSEEIEELLRISSLVNSTTNQIKLKKIIAGNTEHFTVADLKSIDADRKKQEKADARKRSQLYQKQLQTEEEQFIESVIDEYNEKFAYLRYGESSVAILVQEHGKDSFMGTGAFYRYYINDFVEFNDENRDKYLIWYNTDRKKRRHYDMVDFRPYGVGKEDLSPDYAWNTFKGFTAVEPVKGDWERGRKHILETVCNGNEEHFNWFMAWMAQMIQEPEKKTGVSVTLFSEALGSGKTLVSDWLAKLLGDYSTKIAHNKHLTGNFNRHLEHCILLQNEESSYSGDIQGRGTIRNLITGETVTIERKGIDAIEVENFVRILTTTNNTRGIDVVEGERRHFVLEVNDHHKQDRVHFSPIVAQMKSEEGLAAFMYELSTLDYSKIDLGTAPKTEALADQWLSNAPSDLAWTYQILMEGEFTSNLTPRDTEELFSEVKIFGRNKRTEIEKDVLYAAFLAYARTQRKETIDKATFLRNFYKLGGVPKSKKENGDRLHLVNCPFLDDMRDKFKELYGKTVVDDTGQGS